MGEGTAVAGKPACQRVTHLGPQKVGESEEFRLKRRWPALGEGLRQPRF